MEKPRAAESGRDKPIIIKRGTVWELLNAFGMMVAASILWGLCCLPVITIGPASAALYYTIAKVVRRDRDTVISAFFKSFKQNFWQGLWLNLIFLFYFGILASVFLISRPDGVDQAAGMNAAMYICFGFAFLGAWMLPYVYPVLSRFFYSIPQIFFFTVYVGVRYFWASILLLALLIAAMVFSILRPAFLIITPGLYTLIATFLLEPIFQKHSVKDGAEDYETWYGKQGWDERIGATLSAPEQTGKGDFAKRD